MRALRTKATLGLNRRREERESQRISLTVRARERGSLITKCKTLTLLIANVLSIFLWDKKKVLNFAALFVTVDSDWAIGSDLWFFAVILTRVILMGRLL